MIVIDSSLLIAALSEKDTNHARATLLVAEIRRGVWGQALVPDWVFLEVSNFVHRRSGHKKAVRVAREMADPDAGRIIPCSALFAAALELFASSAGADLSFVDAGIVAVARKTGTVNVATYDRGFHSVPGLNVVQDAQVGA